MPQFIIYTSLYPFGLMSESFLATELMVVASEGYAITIVPIGKKLIRRELPSGVKLDTRICSLSTFGKIRAVLGMLGFLPYIHFPHSDFKMHYLWDALKYLYAASLVYNNMCSHNANDEQLIYYSYWLSYPPIAFARYKKEHHNDSLRFVSRGHGSDVYGTEVGVYYPMRRFIMDGLDMVCVVSECGKRFLQEKYPYAKEKVIVSRLGVVKPKHRMTHIPHKGYRLVSCASVVCLKRIELLFQSLNEFVQSTGLEVEWHHFGGGELFEGLQEKVSHCNPNLRCVLHGAVDNSVILDYYSHNQVDGLISVSLSEGIPVSMMEAISYGIPILSTDVGGVKEIVNEKTGYLINKDFSKQEFIDKLLLLLENRDSLSQTAYSFFDENYNAEKNYKLFYKVVLSYLK